MLHMQVFVLAQGCMCFLLRKVYIVVKQNEYFTVFISHLDFICRYRLIFVDKITQRLSHLCSSEDD